METISNEALAAARAKLDAAENQRENILLFHIANGVNIESRTVQIEDGVTGRVEVLVFVQIDDGHLVAVPLRAAVTLMITAPINMTPRKVLSQSTSQPA